MTQGRSVGQVGGRHKKPRYARRSALRSHFSKPPPKSGPCVVSVAPMPVHQSSPPSTSVPRAEPRCCARAQGLGSIRNFRPSGLKRPLPSCALRPSSYVLCPSSHWIGDLTPKKLPGNQCKGPTGTQQEPFLPFDTFRDLEVKPLVCSAPLETTDCQPSNLPAEPTSTVTQQVSVPNSSKWKKGSTTAADSPIGESRRTRAANTIDVEIGIVQKDIMKKKRESRSL